MTFRERVNAASFTADATAHVGEPSSHPRRSIAQVRWGGWMAAIGLFGAAGIAACGSDEPTQTVIQSGCGPGTTMDPSTNLCIPLNDVDSGVGGTSGSGGTTAADAAAGSGGQSGGGSGGTAGTGGTGSTGGDAGAGQAGAGGAAGSSGAAGAAGGTVWTDDDCGDYNGSISQGDTTCGSYYNPVGVCAAGVPVFIDMEPLHADDFAYPSSGLYLRTPSRPGSKPECAVGCAGPGTVAQIRIPIDIPDFNDPDVIVVDHIGSGGDHTGDPWRVVYSRVIPGPDSCNGPTPADCTEIWPTQITIFIETDDPNAPARVFRIRHEDTGGACK
jgi:hypothetical protein